MEFQIIDGTGGKGILWDEGLAKRLKEGYGALGEAAESERREIGEGVRR